MRKIVKKQEGFILFTGLVLLLIITLVVLYGMQSAITQEKSSGGIEDKNIAFQNAETALRYAENYIYSNNPTSGSFTAACTGGLCLPSTNGTNNWAAYNWTSDTTHTIQLPASTVPNATSQPKFMIELLGAVPASAGESAKNSGSSSGGTAYRISVFAFGNRSATVVQLQSVFIKR
jgi:type IV pilus assembly protein PilX